MTRSEPACETQRLLIHNRLLRYDWCSVEELERVSGSRRVAARICELRAEGMSIVTRRVECANGNPAAEYRYEPARDAPPSSGATGASAPAPGLAGGLFG